MTAHIEYEEENLVLAKYKLDEDLKKFKFYQ